MIVAVAVYLVLAGVDSESFEGHSIAVDRPSVKLGVLYPGSHATTSVPFRLTNRRRAPIEFGKPTTTCWCLEPQLPSRSLAPGKSMSVEVRLKELKTYGPFLERVEIPTNDPEVSNLRLTVSGEFWPIVMLNPSVLRFDPIRVGETATQGVELVAHDGKPFSIRSAEFDSENFDVDFVSNVTAKSNRLRVTFRPRSGDPPEIHREFKLRIAHPKVSAVALRVVAQVAAPFVAIPPRLLALRTEPGGLTERSFEIEGPTSHVPVVQSISVVDGPWEVSKWRSKTSNVQNRARIDVLLKSPDTLGLHTGSIQVSCEPAGLGGSAAEIRLPFSGFVRKSLTNPPSSDERESKPNPTEAHPE